MPAKAGIQVSLPAHPHPRRLDSRLRGNDGGRYLAELQVIAKRVAAYSKGSSIPNILQQPFRRNFPAQPFRLGQLVDLAGNGKELRALDIAAFGVSDLLI
jgi:hypothetical protein